MKRALCLCALLALAVACKKKPSPEYMEASLQHESLHDRLGDDAYLDPAMAGVEALLDKVPANSADAAKAAELKARIGSERARVTKENEDRKKAIAEATTPPADFKFSETPRVEEAKPPEPEAAEDAGVANPTAGMPLAELTGRFSRCWERGQPLIVEGRGERQTFVMKDLGVCRDLHKGMNDTILVIEDNRVLATTQKSALVTYERYPDGGLATDAGR